MTNKAIILSRVSSNHQTLEQQTEAVLKEVRKDGYTDDNIIIIEDKESAIKLSEEERNGLNRMKEYINNDPSINAVYLYELSRLSRRQLVLFSIRDFLIERKIQLICLQPFMRLLDDKGEMSQTASLMFSIFSSFSETEMAVKKERMMRGRRHNVSIGKIGGGFPPFGYSVNKEKYYIVDPIASKIVERFYLRYSKGDVSIADIAKEFKEEGLFPNTSFFTLQKKMSDWLERSFYVGKPPYPPIISPSLYDKVQSMRKKRRKAPKKKSKNLLLLKGLVYDGNSGRSLCGWASQDSYYISHYGGLMIKRKVIDPIVWEYAKEMYRKHLMNPTIMKRQIQKELAIICKKADTIRTEIKTIKDRIDKVEERMIFGNLSTERGEELMEQQKEQLSDKERRLLELTNETAYKQQQMVEADFLGGLNEDTMTIDDKIAIIRKVVKKVSVIRISKYIAQISVFNHLNNTVTVYEANSNKQSKEVGVKKVDEYRLKEKQTS